MFFFLSKTIGLLSVPSTVLSLAALVGAILMFTRFRRAGSRILMVCFGVFLLVGFFPIGNALCRVLENRFPVWVETAGPPDGIVILGGAISPHLSEARGQVVLSENAERLTEIPKLARRYPHARIVFTGGNPKLFGMGTPESLFAVDLLESFGIPSERIVSEGDSRNTEENAIFSKRLVQPKPGERWLLVTSALHMPRAIGVFRKAGFPVEAYPVDWHSDGSSPPWWRWLIPFYSPIVGWDALDAAAKEYVGLVVYWLTGRTSELFPRPEPLANRAAAGQGDKRP